MGSEVPEPGDGTEGVQVLETQRWRLAGDPADEPDGGTLEPIGMFLLAMSSRITKEEVWIT